MVDRAFWSGRPALVTGVGGYLGRALVAELRARGARVIGLDLIAPPPSADVDAVVVGDLRDRGWVRDALERHGARTCFHLAGQPGVAESEMDPVRAFETNCEATWCLLEACRLYGKLGEIVVASSNHVYGHQATEPFAEDAPLNGSGVYAASKACADVVARSYARTYGLPLGLARITNTFGGRDHHKEHLVTATLLAVRQGTAPVIRSSGRTVKGYLYIRDTIDAFVRLAEGVAAHGLVGEAFNFAPAEPVSVLEMVQTILRVAGRADLQPVVLGHDDGPPDREHLSIAKARRMLGWQPRYTLEAGIRAAMRDLGDGLGETPA